MPKQPTPEALVVLSGGQDSTTCLSWAKQNFKHVHAVTFNYGQRHAREIEAALIVGKMLGVASHDVVDVGPILKSTSPLVSDAQVEKYQDVASLPGGLEKTFVPGRNALFLVLAANRAAALGIRDLVTGVCEEDFGGYPDCRRGFINFMEIALSRGFFIDDKDFFTIHTPLMSLTKKQTVELARDLPGCLDALAFSHTCYDGQYPPNPNNHASLLRAKGFSEAGIPDPLIVRAKKESLLPPDYPDSGLVEGTEYDTLATREEALKEPPAEPTPAQTPPPAEPVGA